MDIADWLRMLLAAAINIAYDQFKGRREQKKLTDGRCEALTRKGERCKNPAKETRCWRHKER